MINTSFHMVYFEDLEANELNCQSPSVSLASSLDFALQNLPPLEVAPIAIYNSPDSSSDICRSHSWLSCIEEDDEDVDQQLSVSSCADTKSTHSELSGAHSACGISTPANKPRVSKKQAISTFFHEAWQSVKRTFLCANGIAVEPLDADTQHPVPESREFNSDLPENSEEDGHSEMTHECSQTRLIFVKPVEQHFRFVYIDITDATETMSVSTSPFSGENCCSDVDYSGLSVTDTDSSQTDYCSSP